MFTSATHTKKKKKNLANIFVNSAAFHNLSIFYYIYYKFF